MTRPLPEPAPDAVPGDASPVFVDATGGRARLGRRLGLLMGAVLLVFLGALGLGMTTGADVPLTPWSEASAKPQVKLGRPSLPAGKANEPGANAHPRSGAPSGTPRASAAPRATAAPAVPGAAPATPAPAPAATGTATNRPGKSQATPPAWGRKKKNG
ncbi:hypothetical protein [Actinomadura sp. WMMA1423]|uniref:hypothetical protein n=1 Tax=Actinomadura sp. WMMA1423 TaxID=2591108 RepID=UPI00143DF2AE|nr:hypothetical protein [Actinomadura sp. WMMA1423]